MQFVHNVRNINHVANRKLKFRTFRIGDHGIVDYTVLDHTRGDYTSLKFKAAFIVAYCLLDEIEQACKTLEKNFKGNNMEFSICLVITQNYSNYERVHYNNYWEHYLQ